MSWHAAIEPKCETEAKISQIETLIIPRVRDLGDIVVRRVLPSSRRQMVGPFIFFDQMGPMEFRPGEGLDVRPHPHIGLATVTYLFDGEIIHRDSLGTVQPIRPGEINWMTAGRGIVHSERTAPEVRKTASRLSGIQLWVALPQQAEEIEPSFAHHKEDDLPMIDGEGKTVRLIAGSLYGEQSKVPTFSAMFYADVTLVQDARLSVPAEYEDQAIYVVDGTITMADDSFTAGQLLVLRPGDEITVTANSAAKLLLLGGEPVGHRYIWWNFVSSSKERITQAKADWQSGRFAPVPGDDEFIPLPEK